MSSDLAHQKADSMDVFGFWLYIMTDCILFASLFAAYVVLHNNTFGVAGIHQLVDLHLVFLETMALLASSFTYGLAMLSMYKHKKNLVIFWLLATFVLGAIFVGLEVHEFVTMYAAGHSWHTSAAQSAFFALVATHGLHVSMGLLWMGIMIFQLKKFDINAMTKKRLTYLGLFWHFLDIVWIFVFTVVYLLGAL